MLILKVRARLWLYPGPGGWHFIALPSGRAKEIKMALRGVKHGWGSVPVKATIGKTTWRTSIFPDSKSASYLLPVKAEVRRKEGLEEGEVVALTLEVAA